MSRSRQGGYFESENDGGLADDDYASDSDNGKKQTPGNDVLQLTGRFTRKTQVMDCPIPKW